MGIVDGKKQRTERVVGPDKKEAEKALRDAISAYENTGKHFEPSTITVSDYMDYWFKKYVLLNTKYNTQAFYERVLRLQIKPVSGKYLLKSLTPTMLQEFVNDIFREGYAKKSLDVFISVLNNVLKRAVHPQGYLKGYPMQ